MVENDKPPDREPVFWFDHELNHMAHRLPDGRIEHLGFDCRHWPGDLNESVV